MAPHRRLILVLALAGCDRCERSEPPEAPQLSCSAKLLTQEGAHSGTAAQEAGETKAALRKRAATNACASYCNERAGENLAACQPRCLVDIEAAKLGLRVHCSDEAPDPQATGG